MDVTHIRSGLDLVVGTCGDVDWSLPTQKGGGEGRGGQGRRGEGRGGEKGEGEGRENNTVHCKETFVAGFVAKLIDTVHVLGEDSSVEHMLCGEVFS